MEYKHELMSKAFSLLCVNFGTTDKNDYYKYFSKTKPPIGKIKDKISELETEQLENQYKQDRTEKPDGYKPKGDQFDQIFHAIDQGLFGEDAKTSDFYLDNLAVKKRYGKST